MALKNLPLGISTLSFLLESNGIYVDKTEYAFNLINTPGRFFLSRPRRFGKSLFVDTLKEIFEGNQKLFEGLYIHNKWDWTKKYPVIKLDFAAGGGKSQEELDLRLTALIQQNKNRLGVHYDSLDLEDNFSKLISEVAAKYGQRVVVLVDEYDKPILDNLINPLVAVEIKEALKSFYGVLKEQDANLQFIFMTGVTKFSKVSLFSGVNQLIDITIDEEFSSICGYTDMDLREHFSEYL
ncbi:MAG: AAA family ATPase, partial [Bacteroidetes bacterium]|nr:AAA family ATPase [Bacteroidota bacterium]